MGRMGPRGSANARVRLAAARAALVAIVLVTACTPTDESEPPGPDGSANAALTVTTIDPGRLDDGTRARMESEISDVLAGYVVGGFLGDYPRRDFVDGFSDFTGGLTEEAVGTDIDALTVAGFEDVTSVRATRLDARLSFAVVDRNVVGASAWVDFAFDVAAEGSTTKATLMGRISLQRDDGAWAVFGYDLLRGGGSPSVTAEATS